MREWMEKSGNAPEAAYSLIPEFVQQLPNNSMLHNLLQGHLLYRIFYYDASPFAGKRKKPLGGTDKNFADSDEFHKSQDMLAALESMPYVAVRRGKSQFRGWEIKPQKLLSKSDISICADDLLPRVEQKGVDMCVGLDIAALSLKQFADVLVLVSGDSDFVPALKFARTEGRQIILFTLGHRVSRDLKVHADVCVEGTLGDIMAS